MEDSFFSIFPLGLSADGLICLETKFIPSTNKNIYYNYYFQYLIYTLNIKYKLNIHIQSYVCEL